MRYHERAARIIVHKVRLIPEDALFQMLKGEMKRVEPEVVVFAYYDRVSFQSENGKVQVSKNYGFSHIEDHFYITFDENALVPHNNPKKMRKGVTFVVKLNPGGHVLGKLLVRLDAIQPLGLDKKYHEFQLGHSVIRIGLSIKLMEISDIPQYVTFDVNDNNNNHGFRAFMMERRRLRLQEGDDDGMYYYGDTYRDGEEQDKLGLLEHRKGSMQDIYNKALNQSVIIPETDPINTARTSDRMITARTHFTTGRQTPSSEFEKFDSLDRSVQHYPSFPPHAITTNQLPTRESPPQNRSFQRSLSQIDKKQQQLQRQGSSRKDILAKVNPAFLNAHRPNPNQQITGTIFDMNQYNQQQQQYQEREKNGEGNIPPTVWMHPIEDVNIDKNKKSPFLNLQDSQNLGKSQSFRLQLDQDDDNKLRFGSNDSSKFPSPVMILTARQLQEFQETSSQKNGKKNIQQIYEEEFDEKNETSKDTRIYFESNDSSMQQFDFDMNQNHNQVRNNFYNSARSARQLDVDDGQNGFEYERADFVEETDWNRANLRRNFLNEAHMEIQGTRSSGDVIKQQANQDGSLITNGHISNTTHTAQKGVILSRLSERGEEVQGENHSEDFRMMNSQTALQHPETPSFGDSNNINQHDGNVATDASYNYAQMEGLSTMDNTMDSNAPLRMNPPPLIPPLRLDQIRSMAQVKNRSFKKKVSFKGYI